jgi:hypothetical protein
VVRVVIVPRPLVGRVGDKQRGGVGVKHDVVDVLPKSRITPIFKVHGQEFEWGRLR